MSASHIILECLPSFCQKLSELVEIWQSYDKNNFDCFYWDMVYSPGLLTCSTPGIPPTDSFANLVKISSIHQTLCLCLVTSTSISSLNSSSLLQQHLLVFLLVIRPAPVSEITKIQLNYLNKQCDSESDTIPVRLLNECTSVLILPSLPFQSVSYSRSVVYLLWRNDFHMTLNDV